MKALILEENERLIWEDVPTPEPGLGQVRIRVAMCGICGSDMPRVYDHAAHNYPIILGHEFSGTVDALGGGVSGLEPGQHVVGVPLLPCGACPDCLAGNYSLCSHYDFAGSRQSGAMAEYIVLPSENVLPIDESISFEQAATIEPATVALHALRVARFLEGKSATVLGCGIIGLYTLQWLKILGASSVVMIGRGQTGLDAARALEADLCLSTQELSEEELLQRIGTGSDYVFESSGADQTMKLALRLAGKKGTICYIGTPKSNITFSVSQWEQINRKECVVTGSWMSYSAPFPGEEWRMTVEQMKRGALRLVPGMVAGVYPMEKGWEAFELLHAGQAKGRMLLKNKLHVL